MANTIAKFKQSQFGPKNLVTFTKVIQNGILSVVESVLTQIKNCLVGVSNIITLNLGTVTTNLSKAIAGSIKAQLSAMSSRLGGLITLMNRALSQQVTAAIKMARSWNIPEPFMSMIAADLNIIKSAISNFIAPAIRVFTTGFSALTAAIDPISGNLPGPVPIPIPFPPGFAGVLNGILSPLVRTLVETNLNILMQFTRTTITNTLRPAFTGLNQFIQQQ